MARASIMYQFHSGDEIRLTFHTVAEHPDALDEIAARVVRMYHETVGDTVDQDPDL